MLVKTHQSTHSETEGSVRIIRGTSTHKLTSAALRRKVSPQHDHQFQDTPQLLLSGSFFVPGPLEGRCEGGGDRVGASHIGEGVEEGGPRCRGAERTEGGVGPVNELGVLQL